MVGGSNADQGGIREGGVVRIATLSAYLRSARALVPYQNTR